MADLCTAIVSVAIGAAVSRQLTFGVMSLGPALAHEAAQRHAIETFPLESWLGGLWYRVFPATPSLLATIAAIAGLALAFSVLSVFAGVNDGDPHRQSMIVPARSSFTYSSVGRVGNRGRPF